MRMSPPSITTGLRATRLTTDTQQARAATRVKNPTRRARIFHRTLEALGGDIVEGIGGEKRVDPSCYGPAHSTYAYSPLLPERSQLRPQSRKRLLVPVQTTTSGAIQ